jgi:hypothetical protein
MECRDIVTRDHAVRVTRCNQSPQKEFDMRAKRLTLQQRQEIFKDLVMTQDVVTNVRKSYQLVTEKFEITDAQLRQIEDEGLDKEWPPLSEAVQEISQP